MTTPILRTIDLGVDIAGHSVLRNVNVSLAPGAVTAIVGPNGAGKSTLLEALAGVRAVTRGSVERYGLQALVVQRVAAPDALPLTVRQVVSMGAWGRPSTGKLRGDRVTAVLERVALSDIAEKTFASLSGGQRQRALLAQGLARRADIFLLDEPGAGLDSESRQRMRRILDEEADRGALVACVTHDVEAIAAAQHRLVVEAGVVATH